MLFTASNMEQVVQQDICYAWLSAGLQDDAVDTGRMSQWGP